MTLDRSLLLDRAILCADWMMRNQVTDHMDANRGRSIRSYDHHTGLHDLVW